MILALTIWVIGAMFTIGAVSRVLMEIDMGVIDTIGTHTALILISAIAWPVIIGYEIADANQ